jgi:hypothetical protein
MIIIENYPRPMNEKQLKSYFGMASYYRKFIPNFSKIVAPLHALLKANVSFEWAAEQELAFWKLREKLVSKPILQYPDFTKEIILTTDVSNEGLGAILSHGETGKDVNKAKKNYSTSERELLTVVWGVKHFRPYSHGRKSELVELLAKKVELQLLEVKPRTATQGIHSPYLPTCTSILKQGIQHHYGCVDVSSDNPYD